MLIIYVKIKRRTDDPGIIVVNKLKASSMHRLSNQMVEFKAAHKSSIGKQGIQILLDRRLKSLQKKYDLKINAFRFCGGTDVGHCYFDTIY